MNRLFRKLIPLMLAFVLLVSVCPWVMAEEGQDVTILFEIYRYTFQFLHVILFSLFSSFSPIATPPTFLSSVTFI